MFLIDFMNKNANWEELLTQPPYCLSIKVEEPYYLLKYNMVESDFTNPICREARGSIFRKNESGAWICVARSLDKFGNWGESYADTPKIDWSRGVDVQSKIDGSICRLWFDQGEWHLSTSGTIDAFKAECGDSTYGNVFKSIVCAHTTWEHFIGCLHYDCTYWFEMVHPQYNPIVVHYDTPAIYFLGWRDTFGDMKEIRHLPSILMENNEWIRLPKHYNYTCLDDVLEACHRMGEDEEGYVVCAYEQMENDSFLRIKCKGDIYLARHHLRGNSPLTVARIVEMWKEDSLDDYCAYFPENRAYVDEVMNKVKYLAEQAELAFAATKGFANDRKEFALRANLYKKAVASYCFARLTDKTNCATTYFKSLPTRKLVQWIEDMEV